MSRFLYPVLLSAAVALVLAAPAHAKPTKLVGTVGPGFTITLKTTAGKKVTTLKPGAYAIEVTDKASIHNFHLTGPGVNKKTSVGATGKQTFNITLRKGTYRFVCDPHSSSLRGSFTVR
jgi:plastocyanin